MNGSCAKWTTCRPTTRCRPSPRMTGGMFFAPRFVGEMPDDFNAINQAIRSKYELVYHPLNSKQDGSFRKLKVELVDDEGHPLQMQDEKHKPLKYDLIVPQRLPRPPGRGIDRLTRRVGSSRFTLVTISVCMAFSWAKASSRKICPSSSRVNLERYAYSSAVASAKIAQTIHRTGIMFAVIRYLLGLSRSGMPANSGSESRKES
jgi:hypothetical protein